jgi:hypothetical protein
MIPKSLINNPREMELLYHIQYLSIPELTAMALPQFTPVAKLL